MKKNVLLFCCVIIGLSITAQNALQIPNPSFEEFSCCPTTFTQMNCINDWIQASDATSDYMNTCDYTVQIAPQPFPDGEGIIGEIFSMPSDIFGSQTYLEYIGICLPQVLNSNVSYNLYMDIAFGFINLDTDICNTNDSIPPVNITLYGTTDCLDLPFSGSNCPISQGNWQELGYVTVNPYDIHATWGTYVLSFTTPFEVSAITLGPPCELPTMYVSDSIDGCLPYFMFDNLQSSFSTSINKIQKSNPYLKILPNPNNGEFVIDYYSEQHAIISIFSIVGEQIYQERLVGNSMNKQIDLSEVKKGIYLVKFKTGETVLTKRIIIK